MPSAQPQPEPEKYSTLFGTLSNWRNEKTDRNGYKGILPFVSGLRFSTQILYIVKDIFINSKLDAAWGHIVDKQGHDAIIYSNESDIIIYKKIPNSNPHTWNGRTKEEYKAMDFKFINIDAVVGVISCKAQISTIDQKYLSQMKAFTKNVWLFAEYCNFNAYDRIRTNAKKKGYKDFWCLYEWNEKKRPKVKIDVWKKFDEKFISLAKRYK